MDCFGLNQLRKYARDKNFSAIRLAHFDWWLFPINRSSIKKGNKFKLSNNDFKKLLENKVFIKNYIEGIKIVLLAWGWDLDTQKFVRNDWDGYGIRLAKMAHSISLFINNSKKNPSKKLKKVSESIKKFYQQIKNIKYSDRTLVQEYCERL